MYIDEGGCEYGSTPSNFVIRKRKYLFTLVNKTQKQTSIRIYNALT